jgi:D-glycero-alpha-D-manno-heptose-7-phosphate kinase
MDIAQLAYETRKKGIEYGRRSQDQYAATFGGVNYMEFYSEGDRKPCA